MSLAKYITEHSILCQIRLLKPKGVTPTQLHQISQQIHSDLNRVSNILYTTDQLPPLVQGTLKSIRTPLFPKLFLILGTGSILRLNKLLFNIHGIKVNQSSTKWDLPTTLFDTDTKPKDERLQNVIDSLDQSRSNSQIKYLQLNKSGSLRNHAMNLKGDRIPFDDIERLKFKWDIQPMPKPTDNGNKIYPVLPKENILLEPRIFTNFNGMPNDMKLWLKDLENSQNLDKLLHLSATQRDKLDILLHGFKGW